MNIESVSFIVPVYNARDTVVETLQSIVDLQTDRALEIWIVDDGSTDGSEEIVETWLKERDPHNHRIRACLLQIPHGGEAAAMNAGLQQIKSPIVAWVESDVKVHPEWLNCLLSEFDDPEVMGAGGLLLPAENDSAIAKIFGYEIAYKIRSNTADALHITSANAIYRKDIFVRLGHCRVDLGESSFDSEFNQRIRNAGYRLRCNPQAIAWHHFKTGLGECLRRTGWYGYRRPFVQSQVLYPFDRIIALLVLSSGLLFPAIALLPFFPFLAISLAAIALFLELAYSVFLYCHFRDSVLLWSPLLFWTRNVIFLFSYILGWIMKWITPNTA